MKLNWLDATKLAAVAGVVGGLMGHFLSAAQTDQALNWGNMVAGIATAIAGAATAFVMAVRKK